MADSAAVTLRVQGWRYGMQFAEQASLHQGDLTAISNAATTQIRADQGRLASAIALQLLICCCQSLSTPRIQPAAWFMDDHAPNLTQRMFNELSPSPTPVTKD